MKLRRGNGTIIISLLIALLLTILIMPHWAQYLRPHWIMLVLIFWALYFDSRVSVGVAWGMGLLLDLLQGSLLGEHALAMLIIIYLVVKLQRQIRMFPVWQQAATVCVLQLFYLFIIYIIQSIINQTPSGWMYWLPAFTSGLFWPWVEAILRFRQHRFEAL